MKYRFIVALIAAICISLLNTQNAEKHIERLV